MLDNVEGVSVTEVIDRTPDVSPVVTSALLDVVSGLFDIEGEEEEVTGADITSPLLAVALGVLCVVLSIPVLPGPAVLVSSAVEVESGELLDVTVLVRSNAETTRSMTSPSCTL